MGCIQNPLLIIPIFVLLIISNLTNTRFMVEGRTISKLVGSASFIHYTSGREEMVVENEEENAVVTAVVTVAAAEPRRLIGSRPPRCDRRCSTCGHCEAIQVPLVPLVRDHHSCLSSTATPTIANSRGDDISNYKPICWKCKCGDLIFNP